MSYGDVSKTKSPSVKENMLWNSVGSIINLGCQWLMSIVVVRLTAGFEAAGIFSLATVVFNTVQPIIVFRTNIYQISDVKKEYSAGEYLTFRLLTIAAGLVVAGLYTVAIGRLDAAFSIALFLVYKSFSSVIWSLENTQQRAGHLDYAGHSMIMQGLFSLTSFSVFLSIFKDLNYAIASMAVVMLLICLLYDLPKTLSLEKIKLGISSSKIRRLFINCLPSVIAGLAFAAAPSFPRQLLASVFGDSALGIYASVAAPLTIIQMGASYIYQPLISIFSEAYEERDLLKIKQLFCKVTIGIVAVGVACIAALSLFGRFIFSFLFGEQIIEYLYLVNPLMICSLLTGLMWFANDLLLSFRNFRGSLIGGVLSLIVTLLTMKPFLILFEMNGVTYCTMISCLVCLIFMLVSLKISLNARMSTPKL